MASKRSHHNKQDQKIAPGTGYKRHDIFWAKAKDDGYAARSVYKLQEVDRAHKLLLPGGHVLDLGCAPGSWLQYAAQRVGGQGRVIGVDLEKVELPFGNNVTTMQMDMALLRKEMLPSDALPIDVVLSDLAPHTSGINGLNPTRRASSTAPMSPTQPMARYQDRLSHSGMEEKNTVLVMTPPTASVHTRDNSTARVRPW